MSRSSFRSGWDSIAISSMISHPSRMATKKKNRNFRLNVIHTRWVIIPLTFRFESWQQPIKYVRTSFNVWGMTSISNHGIITQSLTTTQPEIRVKFGLKNIITSIYQDYSSESKDSTLKNESLEEFRWLVYTWASAIVYLSLYFPP